MEKTNQQNNIPYQLIIDEMEGNISASDLQQLEAWKTAHAEHLSIYNEILRSNDHIELLALKASLNSERAWKDFAPALSRRPAADSSATLRMNNFYKWTAVAAIVFAIVYCASLGFFSGMTTVTTARNEHRKITLPDGSEVMMNENSSLSYSENNFSNNRTVKLLMGEAFFEVKHKEKYPFLIQTPEIDVRDIGTSFNVKIRPEEITVIVHTGLVSIENAELNKKLRLSANDKGIFNRKTKEMTSGTNTDLNYKSWYDRKIQFTKTLLPEVVQDLREVFGSEIILRDPELKNKRLTAFFENQSEEQIMKVISVTLKLHIEKKDSTFVLYK